MDKIEPLGDVLAFYDSHPINESQILEKLELEGIAPDAITASDLSRHDQDHYGGLPSNDALAELARIGPGCHVLDVCSGMGGPARYFADRLGCRVTGIDLNTERVAAARRLTALVGLDDRVRFENANALAMPFDDATFDVVVSQEGFCHIPDKQRLVAECGRVLKPGGRIAFTDILVTDRMTQETRDRLSRGMAFHDLATEADYRAALERAGCEVVEVVDLGETWRDILADRLAMYRSLEDQTVARYGRAHFDKWDEAYSFFVGLYRTGELGGGRFLARRR